MSEPRSGVLRPSLTAYDRRVLGVLPVSGWAETARRKDLLSAHQVAERLGTDDVKGTREILRGLVHFGHAHESRSRSRKLHVYWREDEG